MLKDLDIIIVIGFAIAGIVWIYNAFRLGRETALFDSKILYPGKCERKDCRDAEGFMAFMRPKCFLMGIGLLLIAAAYGVDLYIGLPTAATIVLLCLAAVFFGWCFWCYNRAARRFW